MRMYKRRVLVVIAVLVGALALVFGGADQATATLVVDQQNVIPIGLNTYQTDESTQQTLGTFSQFAQTFTVGVAGTLSRIDVEVFHESNPDGSPRTNGVAIVDLVTTSGGVPSASGLAGWTITAAGSSDTVGSFVSHDLGADAFAVLPGQIYAIVFTWNHPPNQVFSGFHWVRAVSDTYVGGDAFFSTFGANPTPWVPNALEPNSYDYGFRTFVDVPATVPEAATMLLLGSGLAGLAGLALRGKRQ